MIKNFILFLFYTCSIFILCSCGEDEKPVDNKTFLETPSLSVAGEVLNLSDPSLNSGISLTDPIIISFTGELDVTTAASVVYLRDNEGTELPVTVTLIDGNTALSVAHEELTSNQTYTVEVTDELKGASGQIFEGVTATFTTTTGTLTLTSIKIDGEEYLNTTSRITDISQSLSIELTFSQPLNTTSITSSSVRISRNSATVPLTFTFSDENKKLTVTSVQPLVHLSRHLLTLQNSIKGAHNETLSSNVTKIFYTVLDPTPKRPVLPNDEDSDDNNENDLLSVVQKQTFKYFYDYADANSGMARERNGANYVTSGGSGFGIMSLIVGIERNFITEQEGLDRMDKIITFLENADRFHGAWPHWMNGTTGDVIPFSANDNGGDLVETAFLVEGLITFRQYLTTESIPDTYDLVNRINTLWQGVDWEWYRKETNENVLYWHWSPNPGNGWVMNMPIRGWNEALIVYTLAAASPTHTIPQVVYTNGWARNGGMQNGNTYEGIQLPLGPAYGGPLFFTHYSFLGMDPNNLTDQYADYWTQNVNHTLINYQYCVRNPKNFVGYSDECWGLTASDNHINYNAHSPTNDLGVITPTAALSSFPYTPTESMKALKFFYYTMGDRLWGDYGFYDAFNITEGWTANSYLAIDQGPIVVMIENYRTGLLWDLFMSAPEVQDGLDKLGFTY